MFLTAPWCFRLCFGMLTQTESNAPVRWCVPLWKKYIHGFQTLQVELRQRNGYTFISMYKTGQREGEDSMITVLNPQQLLEILTCFRLHDWLTGADVWKRHQTLRTTRLPSPPEPRAGNSRRLSSRCSCFKPLSSSDTNAFICLMSIPWRFCRRNNSFKYRICPSPKEQAHERPHIVRALQIPGLLTEIAKHVGEVLISDLIEDLNVSSDVNFTLIWSAAIVIRMTHLVLRV